MFLSLAVFTQYEYPRRIVVLSPPDKTRYKYHPYVLGGLYELARQEYDGFAADGDSDIQLSEAHGIGIEEQENLPNGFGTDIRFGYEFPVLGGSSTRKMTIESENWTTDQLQSVGEERDRDGIGAGIVFRGLRWIRRYLNLAIPQTLLNIFSTRNGNILSKLDHADTAILIAPAPASEGDFPEGVEKYRKLCKRYDDALATDVVIATIEAGPVAETENLKINSRAFRNHCAHRLCVNDTDCRVVPVDRFAENRDYRGGFDELLEEVSK